MYSDTQLCVGKGWSTLLMMAGLVKGEPESPRSSLTCLSANCNDPFTSSRFPLCSFPASPHGNQKPLFLFLSLHISSTCSEFI